MSEQPFKTGDRVIYTGTFTKALKDVKGTIVAMRIADDGLSVADVNWDGPHRLRGVYCENIAPTTDTQTTHSYWSQQP